MEHNSNTNGKVEETIQDSEGTEQHIGTINIIIIMHGQGNAVE